MTMKKAIHIIAAMLLISAAGMASERTGQIDRYKAVFDSRPTGTPTAKTPDAPLAGNGDIGITMCSTGDMMRLYVGKNDFWRTLPGHGRGGVALPGGLDITSREIKEGVYHAEQLPGSARIDASFTTADNCLRLRTWVAATDNKVVIEIHTDKATTLAVNLWGAESENSTTAGGIDRDGVRYVTRSFEGDEFDWPCRITMALRCAQPEIEMEAGSDICLLLTAYTDFDSPAREETARKEALKCSLADIEALQEAHNSWWEQFWSLSHVSFGDEFLEKYYYQSQYLFACASREGKFAPGLWGPFITVDNSAWCGDYHLNYNYQSPYWGSYSSNHICLVDNYDKPVLEYMEKGGMFAKELLGTRGVYYPVGIGPMGYTCSTFPIDPDEMERIWGTRDNTHDLGAMFWGQKSNASFAAVNMMMRFYATWDKAYAEKVYPYIKACADFWEDWLVLEDGRYVDRNDAFWEEPSWGGRTYDTNPVCSLGLIRMVMNGAYEMSRFLGRDRECRKIWKDISENLSDIPVKELPDGGKTLLCSEPDGDGADRIGAGLNRVMMHGLLIPSGVCGPMLTPEINDIMLSDISLWEARRSKDRDWGNSLGNGIETVYPCAVRLGWPARNVMENLKERISMFSYPNCHIGAHGGGLEALAAVPFTINEMMLQSFEGVVRIFPDWVREQDASFETLRAEGAFLVSSSMKDGEVVSVKVLSEQGRPLVLENPWPGCKVSVSRNGRKARTFSGELLRIRTRAGRTIVISKK